MNSAKSYLRDKNLKVIPCVLIFLMASFEVRLVHAASEINKYLITVESLSDAFIKVEASLYLNDGRLTRTSGGSYDWPTGWAEFIKDVKVQDNQGNALEVSIVLKGDSDFKGDNFYWEVRKDNALYQGPATVVYKIDTSYIHTDWDFGNEQAGKILDGQMYTVTHPLFISSNPDSDWQVVFNLPTGWKVTSPWLKTDSQENTFGGHGLASLQENSIILGTRDPFIANVEGFEFRLMLLGSPPEYQELLTPLIGDLTRYFMRVFPETPKGPYLLTIFPAGVDDGESFTNSATLTTKGTIAAGEKSIWAIFIAHEIFHFWNGEAIYGDPYHETEWLSEGFTEYFAMAALLNSGVMTSEDFLRNAEQISGNYLYFMNSSNFEGVSILSAGDDKGKNRFGVYDAGWVIALALDTKIYQATDGGKSLKDLMHRLYIEFGLKEEPFTLSDLRQTASKMTGENLDDFFETYLSQRNTLDLDEILGSYGLDLLAIPYANRATIQANPNASDAEKEHWIWFSSNYFD